MDFAIAPACRAVRSGLNGREDGEAWEVLCLRQERGIEVAQRLASFGYRSHAEAFLADLLAMAKAHAGDGLVDSLAGSAAVAPA